MRLLEMRARAREFACRLEEVKRSTEPPWWGWYPYAILPSVIEILDGLLTAENRRLLEEPADRRIADIAGADGDLAFFLETLGFEVDIFEGGPAEVRELRLEGPRRLKKALASRAGIYAIDLDHDFKLPRPYTLAFCLGVLYHLKNPMLALETLASSVEYCVISTKVARYVRAPWSLGTRRVDVSALPMSYLLDPFEVSETDDSNYWVFTELGLQRLAKRAGWKVLDMKTYGNLADAEPASRQEARAWCLLRSERLGGTEHVRASESAWESTSL